MSVDLRSLGSFCGFVLVASGSVLLLESIGLTPWAEATAAPAVDGSFIFDDPNTETFPMQTDLVADFSFSGGPEFTGRFTGSITMEHQAAGGTLCNGVPDPGNEVPLILHDLVQTANSNPSYQITNAAAPPSGGTATSINCDEDFPATSSITVNYLMETPFSPPNDPYHGTHEVVATISCWPPDAIYVGTGTTDILDSGVDGIPFTGDDQKVGVLTIIGHSQSLPKGVPTTGSVGLAILAALLVAAGAWMIRSRGTTRETPVS